MFVYASECVCVRMDVCELYVYVYVNCAYVCVDVCVDV